ncbi:hypothetical protein RGU70_13630 [Herbaspirillum sp. RTI4]|uniref:hypothetical protein n=1 Tax=Herbaspirillum sp. RTI4 TaxID=3048640 RepID=UPI002AB4CE72|nr:hypothetical protein [Herbaspirillum sp. RTI4]MDY7579354.1 hypothetical protein [Herbaspirillum sp. RTI4]MEA9980268.1 hypothetical protein [Herbaspirillum sp. RTI4]
MASETDIANGALALLGDTANVSALNPPSGSIQAVHCARFYPMARDQLLEMHTWGFATKRVQPALLSGTPPAPWAYSYQAPSDVLNFLSILDPNATDDYSQGLQQYGSITGASQYNIGLYTPQPFAVEMDANGNQVIYTNQQYAMLRYTGRVTDTTTFGPLFTEALTRLLASKLAGPVIKGSEGRAEAKAQLQSFQAFFSLATASDANQHRQNPAQSVDWIVNR